MTVPPLTYPVVHLNGTSRTALLAELEHAHVKLKEAIDALMDASPNARDYYVVPGSFEPAMDEHCARLDRVRAVREEIEAIILHIVDTYPERR